MIQKLYAKKSTLVLILLILISTSGLAFAEKSYISDVLIVSLRSGPANSYRIIKALRTGDSFTVLEEQNKFLKVITEEKIEGWLPKQYTSNKPPAVLQTKFLTSKITKMTANNATLNKLNSSLKDDIQLKSNEISELNETLNLSESNDKNEISELQHHLETIKDQYNTILIDSKDSINIKKEHDILVSKYRTLNDKTVLLEKENSTLSNRQNIYWLLAGGGLVLLGIIIGKLSKKKQNRSLSL